jgi:uncharacterized repeat protein (TIGR01451 family)
MLFNNKSLTMKRILLTSLFFFSLFFVADAQVFRTMTARYNNPSVKGNIVYVANNIATTPLAITTEAPPGGTATNNNNTGAYLDIDTDVPAHTVKLAYGSVWNYHSNGAVPANNPAPTNWKQPAYVMPAAWNVGAIPVNGAGKYGYSNPANLSITTCIKSSAAATLCVPAAGAKYISYYFRRTVNFTLAELTTTFRTILVNMKRNDGIVVYINGVERIRNNMPNGLIGNGTLASTNIAMGPAENLTRQLSPSYFVAGANTIAVEVHLQNANNTNMSFDMEVLGVDNAATFSSSSADLNLNSCSQILWAGLYWGGNHQSGVGGDTTWINNNNATTIKLKVPGAGVYQTISSTQNDYHNSTRVPGLNHAGYFCFADITSLINAANPNGTYTVADLVAPVGFNSCGAGWTIAVAYSNPTEIQRNLSIFDGSAVIKIGNPAMFVPIAGFLTPPAGPVSCELGVVAYDGDRGSPGLLDEFYFKQDSNRLVGAFTNLSPNATSNLNDFFNSTISNKGVVSLARNPAHLNTLGYDADIIEIPNPLNVLLGNSQTSASMRFSSTVEDFFIQVVSTAISIYNPSFAFDKSATDLSGGSLTPGDSLRYQMSYDNVGNDASTNSRIIDNIPFGTAFKPGSLRINGIAKTDAAGDDEAEYDFANSRIVYRLGVGANAVVGGEIASGSNGNVTFDIYAPSSCTILSCNGTLRNRARMTYGGKLSLLSLQDSSGVYNAGCIDPVDKIDIVAGTCAVLGDTILTNTCLSLTVMLPIRRYAGYTFHSGIPFTPFNRYNGATPVTFTRVMYAYYDAPGACLDDTARINIFITGCPDIDDDNDGLPDYLESTDPVAIADQDGDGRPNWADNSPGAPILWVDYNNDNINDWYDPGADADNDGILNFYDVDYFSYVDTNGDGVNDRFDKDLDGIPNYLDLDSDNDGIPDTVESFGVDADGDGRIDNYVDVDTDGLSDNVDTVTSGGDRLRLSGLGLGALDTDGDTYPNYLDLDSDNDGIPDITEAFGTDANNSAKVNVFADVDGDGYADALDADVGNDLVAENSAASILKTSADGNGDGRTDTWPFKNMDIDSKPNPYDLDSDGDGITDVKEAQITDADWNGQVDGAINTNGRNSALAALPALIIPNTDGIGRTNPYDIDSDEDGIPDNVEGLTTLGYLLPAATDTDLDGIDDSYDNFNGFGGDGIHPVDQDGDTQPDYLDSDTDNDGLIDRVEGNDLNFNELPDDNVTLTGTDTDGDGLDDRFDNNNSSAEATSAFMGNGGTTSGDPTPGSITTVQHTTVAWGCTTERDWRCIFYILSCDIISFKAVLQNQQVKVDWSVLCKQEADHFIVQRSIDGTSFTDVAMITGRPVINEVEAYSAIDNITGLNADILYYRLLTIMRNGKRSISNIISIRNRIGDEADVMVLPNPVRDRFQLLITANSSTVAEIKLFDGNGKTIFKHKELLQPGNNTFTYNWTNNIPSGLYYLRVNIGLEYFTKKLYVIK